MIDIHGGKWPIGLGDTGTTDVPEDDTGAEVPEYAVTPDQLSPGINEVLTVTAEAVEDWSTLSSVTAIGDLEVVDFKADGAQLLVGVIVHEAAMEGPAHLIFEFDDGDVQIAREAIYIEGLEEEVPADTGLVDDEPTND